MSADTVRYQELWFLLLPLPLLNSSINKIVDTSEVEIYSHGFLIRWPNVVKVVAISSLVRLKYVIWSFFDYSDSQQLSIYHFAFAAKNNLSFQPSANPYK